MHDYELFDINVEEITCIRIAVSWRTLIRSHALEEKGHRVAKATLTRFSPIIKGFRNYHERWKRRKKKKQLLEQGVHGWQSSATVNWHSFHSIRLKTGVMTRSATEMSKKSTTVVSGRRRQYELIRDERYISCSIRVSCPDWKDIQILTDRITGRTLLTAISEMELWPQTRGWIPLGNTSCPRDKAGTTQRTDDHSKISSWLLENYTWSRYKYSNTTDSIKIPVHILQTSTHVQNGPLLRWWEMEDCWLSWKWKGKSGYDHDGSLQD